MSALPPGRLLPPEDRPIRHPAGDDQLHTLYTRYWTEIVNYIRKSFGDGPPDPEDAAQTAFTQYATLKEPGLVENPRAYLYASARHMVLNFKRRRAVQRRGAVEAEFFYGGTEVLHAERVIEAKQRVALIEAVVKKLPLKQREAFILNRIHEMSYAEIARRKRISESEARRLVRMAMKAIDRALLDTGSAASQLRADGERS